MFYKNILITGCNRGIGLELVRIFCKQDSVEKIYAVVRPSISACAELNELAKASDKLVVIDNIDIVESDSFDKIKAKMGSGAVLDLIINNAGFYHKTWLHSKNLHEKTNEKLADNIFGETAETLRKTYEVNCIAPFNLVKNLFDYLVADIEKNGKKGIFSMSSKMGSIADNTSGGSYSYRSSKSALNQITKSFACDFKNLKINCVNLHPGWVRTEMGGENAIIDTVTSACGLFGVMKKIYADDKNIMSGRFFDYSGKEIPY